MSNGIKIEVSPGELIDRLTILEIKLDRMHDAQKRRNVETEHAVIRAAYEAHVPASEELHSLVDELREVNLRLWAIEDDIRDARGGRSSGPRSWRSRARSI